MPRDLAALCALMEATPADVAVFPLGLGSNLIVRDGGLPGLVVRLGRGFAAIGIDGDTVTAGAAARDAQVAQAAAEAGLDLAFLRTIPGAIGGAIRMNAGCYGCYVADCLVSVRAVDRAGRLRVLTAAELDLRYRSAALPEGWVIADATFRAPKADPAGLRAKMAAQIARRDASQPSGERSAGSTFRNPSGASSTGRADDAHDLKAWRLIQRAGMQGARLGGAQMSEKHANFLINTGGATAADLEGLGERVRKEVLKATGIALQWEIKRVGIPAPDRNPAA